MKIKALTRSADDFEKQRPSDLQPVQRTYDPVTHPFQRAREYVRALNAVKLDKIFAKPFIAALDGHTDGVYAMARNPKSVMSIISGAGDGVVKAWNLGTLKETASVEAHTGIVWGLSFAPSGTAFLSCSEDSTAKLWSFTDLSQPQATFLASSALRSVDHHAADPLFATAGDVVSLWDENRREPVHTFSWGADTTTLVRFNRAETHIFVAAAHDRSLVLFDVRTRTPLRKLITTMRTNAACWNPMEPLNFTAASEDTNLYTYDMRHLAKALCVHKDHVGAVLDVDYSPTGREFVSGSYDRTLRIFNTGEGRSREVYHTKRMQRCVFQKNNTLFCVLFSPDAKFVLSGSDDTNIRVWKAQAAAPLRTPVPREQRKLDYLGKLKEQFAHLPQIRRIARHRHIPRAILKEAQRRRESEEAYRKRMENKRKHSAPGTVTFTPARKKHIVEEQE